MPRYDDADFIYIGIVILIILAVAWIHLKNTEPPDDCVQECIERCEKGRKGNDEQ